MRTSASTAANLVRDDQISNFESISGSKNGHDVITGTSGSNTVRTYGGNDKVYAQSGTDRVYLGDGNDYVRVGGGNETFDGGSGKDYISYYDSSNGVRIDLRDDEVSGSWAVNDTIKDFESASGSKTGHDELLGTDGSNTLRGYGGDDTISGRGGNDKLYGGKGDDDITGGAGADTFHFDKGDDNDVVTDFENNVDTLEFDNFGLSKAAVFDRASNVNGDVVFDLGSGDRLTIENITKNQIFDDFDIV